MHRFSKKPFLILGILLTTFVCGSDAQNCAIPGIVTLSQDHDLRTECVQNGTELARIATRHIESIRNVTVNPHDFIEFQVEEEQLILKVNTTMCPNLVGGDGINKTPIDESWAKNIEIQAEFICTDDRSKIVTFVIPITDQNTQSPYFENFTYNLTIEPCVNGTHQGHCPLNFEFPIIAFDDDRDEKNADMEFRTNITTTNITTDMIRITSSKLELHRYMLKSTGKQYTGRQMSLHLYLKESNAFTNGESFSFELIAYNTEESPNGVKPYGTAIITLTFGDIVLEEPLNPLDVPVFSNFAYYAKVTSLFGAESGSELQDIHPTKVYAAVSNESLAKVIYSMESDIFEIDPETGEVRYIMDLMDRAVGEFLETVKVYEIRADLESYGFLKSFVPLIVFFNIKDGNSSGCSSTTMVPPTEPSTCPVVTCPTPLPCGTSTTTDGGEYETTSASPSINSSTTTESTVSTTWETRQPTETTDITSPSFPTTTTENSEVGSTPSTITTSTEETSITMPNDSTTIPTSSSTDVSSLETTTSSPTYGPPTTEIPMPITTPGNNDSTCCGNCEVIVTNFTCPLPLTNMLYPDPYDCSIYHSCRDDGRGEAIDELMACPEGLIFCPKLNRCEEEAFCCEGELCKNEEIVNCMPNDHPDNICRGNEYEADPYYCDVFHHCDNTPYLGYTDCQKGCAKGTVWCQALSMCTWIYECPCEDGRILRPPKCNLCQPKNVGYPTWLKLIKGWISNKMSTDRTNQ